MHMKWRQLVLGLLVHIVKLIYILDGGGLIRLLTLANNPLIRRRAKHIEIACNYAKAIDMEESSSQPLFMSFSNQGHADCWLIL